MTTRHDFRIRQFQQRGSESLWSVSGTLENMTVSGMILRLCVHPRTQPVPWSRDVSMGTKRRQPLAFACRQICSLERAPDDDLCIPW